MTFKKGQKAWNKKEVKVEEPKAVETAEEVKEEVIEEETPVSSVVENEIQEVKVEEPKNTTGDIIGSVGNSVVVKPKGRIKFEAQVAPYPMFKLPAELRNYLVSKGLTTEAYKMTKEELDKKGVDMKMIEALKKFLTEKL